MKYIVFITTNIKDRRHLIGVHRTDTEEFDGYLGDGVLTYSNSSFMFPKSPFQFAVKKYGVKSFSRITLMTCDTYEDAVEKANKLIESIIDDVNYYNFEKILYRPVYQFSTTGEFKCKWDSFTDICDFYGYPLNRIMCFIALKESFNNSFWSFHNKINIDRYKDEFINRISYIYNKEGKMIKCYPFYEQTAQYVKGSIKEVLDAIKTQRDVKGYYISNKMVDLFKPKARRQFKMMTFHVYKDTGEYVGAYKGKKVMNVIKLHSWKKIKNIFTLHNQFYNGFYISLATVDKVPVKVDNRRFEVYDKYGNLLDTIKDVSILREKYNLRKCEVENIKHGKKFDSHYVFKYFSK